MRTRVSSMNAECGTSEHVAPPNAVKQPTTSMRRRMHANGNGFQLFLQAAIAGQITEQTSHMVPTADTCVCVSVCLRLLFLIRGSLVASSRKAYR